MKNTNTIRWIAPLAIIIATLVVCFRSPYNASDMETVPDSVEYCAGAYNMLAGGTYEIEIQNQWYPPRYSPWFSAIFLLPCYVLAPLKLGGPIIAVLIMSVLAVLIAYRIGARISGTGGAFLSAIFLLFLPIFRTSAMRIMTDAPCAALCLAAASFYLEFDRESPTRKWLVAGLICALSASLRPLTAFLCLPFILFAIKHRPTHGLRKCMTLLLPSAVMGSLTLLYNYRTFGNALRSGYNYWCAVPYDYFTLTFGLRYLSSNMAHLFLAGMFVIPTLLLLFLLWARYRDTLPHADSARKPAGKLLFFCAVSMTPLTLIHLLYFFPEQRFFLPLIAFASVLTGALGGVFIRVESQTRSNIAAVLLVFACMLVRMRTPEHIPSRRIAAEKIDRFVPEKATVISATDPAYFALVLRHRNIRFLPVSRTVEYASKVIVLKKIAELDPAPRNSYDHRAPALMKGGAQDPVRWTADELRPAIAALSQSGRAYYVDTGTITPSELGSMQKLFSSCAAVKITPGLYLLGPPNSPSSDPAD